METKAKLEQILSELFPDSQVVVDNPKSCRIEVSELHENEIIVLARAARYLSVTVKRSAKGITVSVRTKDQSEGDSLLPG